MRGRRSRRDERGAIILLVSLIMTVLLIIVSFAIDLGTQRATKRDAQAIADLVALDAGYFLSGSSPGSLGVAQPRNACIAGIESAQRNVPGFLVGLSEAAIKDLCAELPETSDGCMPEQEGFQPWTVEIPDGQRTLTLQYPVLDDELDTSRFAGAGKRDGTDPCERLSVRLHKVSGTSFAGIMGIGELSTGAGSVVRGSVDDKDLAPPAVLLLERTDCGVFTTSANGVNSGGIIVEANGESPGLIHADTNATTNCSGNSSGNFGIYGTSLGSAAGGGPSIVVTDGNGSPPRVGAIRSAATNGRGAAVHPGGISVAHTWGELVSRKIVDDKYNKPGVNPAITNLHAAAAGRLLAAVPTAGHHSVGCTQADLDAARTALHTRVYVTCSSVNATLDFTGFSEVVFAGNINLQGGGGGGDVMTFPTSSVVTVRGSISIQSGALRLPHVTDFTVGNGISVSSGGRLAVNSTTADNCDGRSKADGWTRTTRMAVFGGSSQTAALNTSGPTALCQTTVYLAGPITSTYTPQQVPPPDGSVTAVGTCTLTKPCPKDTASTYAGARYTMGGSVVHWSAPNQHLDSIPDPEHVGLEDLALWMEGSGLSEMKSGAQFRASGVFFGPNGSFESRSPATGNPRDAQFVARKGAVLQGTLQVAPNKNNAINIPLAGSYSLIR